MVDKETFQRRGAVSNAHVGTEFEQLAAGYFRSQGIALDYDVPIEIGHNRKKMRRFDLASLKDSVVVECKSHTWTSGGNVPSAKIIVWNEAMYIFTLLPKTFRKILFVTKSLRKQESLAEYYMRNYGYMVPLDVEIIEYCEKTGEAREIHGLAA